MALPKIAISTYNCVLPNSKTKIEYRGFKVSEEKILLLAAAETGGDFKSIYTQINNVLAACVIDSSIDLSELSNTDFEYLFLKIKSAAKGSVEELKYKCNIKSSEDKVCNTTMQFSVDFDKVELSGDMPETLIKIQEDFEIELKIPNIKNIMEMHGADLNEFEMIACSIKSVKYDGTLSTEFTLQEALELVENLTSDQLKPLGDFFKSVPKLQYVHSIACSGCGHKHELKLSGLESFFA